MTAAREDRDIQLTPAAPPGYPEDYPYGPQPSRLVKPAQQTAAGDSASDAAVETVVVDTEPIRLSQWIGDLLTYSGSPPDYVVPHRFGMSAIVGITTALAFLFGGLRVLDAEPVVYLFFGLQAIVICLVQMFNGAKPRLASSIAGAVLAPLFVVQLLDAEDILPRYGGERLAISLIGIVIAVPFGAFLGYLTGTCAAGIFLVLEKLEHYLSRRWGQGLRGNENV